MGKGFVSGGLITFLLQVPPDVETLIERVRSEISPAHVHHPVLPGSCHITLHRGVFPFEGRILEVMLSAFTEFEFEIGGINVFKSSETGKRYEVLYVEVLDPTGRLSAFNRALQRFAPPRSFSFVPHLTISYLHPETHVDYISEIPLRRKVTSSIIEVRDCDRNLIR